MHASPRCAQTGNPTFHLEERYITRLHFYHRACFMIAGLLLISGMMLHTAAAQNEPPGSLQPAVPLAQPAGSGQSAPPVTITLQDALERARKIDAQYLSAQTDVSLAREDRVQARAALLPSASATTQYLNTQGNGVLPAGRFISNNGVHVYRAWGVVHEDLSAGTLLRTGYKRASAAEAIASAKAEIAQRGLTVTVTKNYYTLAAAQRKYSTAQQALQQAQRFLAIAQESERLRQVARSDVVKGQLQFELIIRDKSK